MCERQLGEKLLSFLDSVWLSRSLAQTGMASDSCVPSVQNRGSHPGLQQAAWVGAELIQHRALRCSSRLSERPSILLSPEIARIFVSLSSGIMKLNKTFFVE